MSWTNDVEAVSSKWSDIGADPIADIARAMKALASPRFKPTLLVIPQRRAILFAYVIGRKAIGKRYSKRSWRRYRGRAGA